MFKGSLPADALRIISEIIKSFTCDDIYIGCSGNFTIERAIFDQKKRLHGCDVSMYTCTLGRLFANLPLNVTLKDDVSEEFLFLKNYLDTPYDIAATVMICTDMLEGMQKKGNVYYERMRRAYVAQFARIHADTVKKLKATGFSVESFFAGDAVDWVDTVPRDSAFISFPPFWAKGYEKLSENLEKTFNWEKPEYPILDDERKAIYFQKIQEKKYWIFGTNAVIPELSEHLHGICKTVSQAVTIFIYASNGPIRRVGPRMGAESVNIQRLSKGIGLGSTIEMIQLKSDQFKAIRSQYLNINIVPRVPPMSFAVLVDGLMIGCFALNTIYRGIKEPNEYSPYVYLYSDFAVAPTDYPRLSKLVLYAALSHEGKMLCEGMAKRRINGLLTSAFAKNPISMKYRGLFELISRKKDETKDEWLLCYHSPLGRWSLKEGFDIWRSKYL